LKGILIIYVVTVSMWLNVMTFTLELHNYSTNYSRGD